MLMTVVALFVLAFVLLLVRQVPVRDVFSWPLLGKIILVAGVVTALFTLYHQSRGSGMGLLTEYGFPRGHFWRWQSIEGADGYALIKWRYLLENLTLYTAIGTVVYVLVRYYLRTPS